MKKCLSTLLSVLLLVSCLTACGSAGGKEVDLASFYETEIAGKYEMPSLEAVSGEMEDAFYPGLSGLDLAQKVLYVPLMNVQATEILMVQAKTEDDASAVESIFAARLESLDELWSQYLPDQYALVQSAQVVRTGRYVTLIVSEHQQEIEAALAEALK